MTPESPPAPLYRDANALCLWLLGRFDGDSRVLSRRLATLSVDLLVAITFALKDRRRAQRLATADEQLIALRTLLRLAASLGYLDDAQLLHGLALADGLGRQIGGWQRRQAKVG